MLNRKHQELSNIVTTFNQNEIMVDTTHLLESLQVEEVTLQTLTEINEIPTTSLMLFNEHMANIIGGTDLIAFNHKPDSITKELMAAGLICMSDAPEPIALEKHLQRREGYLSLPYDGCIIAIPAKGRTFALNGYRLTTTGEILYRMLMAQNSEERGYKITVEEAKAFIQKLMQLPTFANISSVSFYRNKEGHFIYYEEIIIDRPH